MTHPRKYISISSNLLGIPQEIFNFNTISDKRSMELFLSFSQSALKDLGNRLNNLLLSIDKPSAYADGRIIQFIKQFVDDIFWAISLKYMI